MLWSDFTRPPMLRRENVSGSAFNVLFVVTATHTAQIRGSTSVVTKGGSVNCTKDNTGDKLSHLDAESQVRETTRIPQSEVQDPTSPTPQVYRTPHT